MAPKKKNPAAVALSKLAARGRMKKLTPEQRRDIARSAARARWGKANEPLVNDQEVAEMLGINVERLTAVLNEAGLHLRPKQGTFDKAKAKARKDGK